MNCDNIAFTYMQSTILFNNTEKEGKKTDEQEQLREKEKKESFTINE